MDQNEIADQIARIKEKLEKAQFIPPPAILERHRELGIPKYNYQMKKPLKEEAIQRFEKKHGIHLPEDYRAFIREVGDGGAGPYYGLIQLEKWHGDLEPRPRVPHPAKSYLASTCALTERLRGDDWEKLLPPYEWDRYQGAMTICSQGDTYYALLIISGEARGRVCYADFERQPPRFPPDKNFLAWYERWLDEALSGKESLWF